MRRLSDGVPDLRVVRPGRPAQGEGVARPWIGITPREAAAVDGLAVRPLLPPGAEVVVFYDRSALIERAIDNLSAKLIEEFAEGKQAEQTA